MSSTLKIAIAGLGTVGAGVIKIIQSHSGLLNQRCGRTIEVVAISARDRNKDRGFELKEASWCENPLDLVSSDAEVVLELVGGDSGIAKDLCESALKNGKHVITANKALIAKHGMALAKLAEDNNVQFAYEAAVAGGIPIIKALREGLAGNEILGVAGIMNGTCNYILTEMEANKQGFADVLQRAQDLGYAEAEPSLDVDGFDAAHKLAILTSLAYGVALDFDAVHVEGVRDITIEDLAYAKELGYNIRLLGICRREDGVIQQRVHPCLVKLDYPIARIEGVQNAIYVKGDAVGDVVLQGPGAGEGATASAVLSDIVDIALDRFNYTFGKPVRDLEQGRFQSMQDHNAEYYLRIPVVDETGVLARVAQVLSDNGVSVESILQKPADTDKKADIVAITHKVKESAIFTVLDTVAKLDGVIGDPKMIRIE